MLLCCCGITYQPYKQLRSAYIGELCVPLFASPVSTTQAAATLCTPPPRTFLSIFPDFASFMSIYFGILSIYLSSSCSISTSHPNSICGTHQYGFSGLFCSVGLAFSTNSSASPPKRHSPLAGLPPTSAIEHFHSEHRPFYTHTSSTSYICRYRCIALVSSISTYIHPYHRAQSFLVTQ